MSIHPKVVAAGPQAGQSGRTEDAPTPSTGVPPSGHLTTEPSIDVATDPPLQATIDVNWLRQRLAQAAAVLESHSGRPVRHISVAIVADTRMTELNRRYLGRQGTTDVLSFDLAEPDGGPRAAIQADIVVCADEAARGAETFGHSIERELLLYALHGLLHCADFDDAEETSAKRMHAEEDRILESIGVGPTFKPDPRRRPA